MNTSYISFSLFVILAVSLGLVSSQSQCNTTAYGTYAYTLNKTYVSLKSNSTNKLRIGLLGGLYFGDTMQRTIGSVITYQLNNDLSVLPDVEVEFYWSSIRSTSDILLATMFYINQLKVNGLIAGYSSTDARTAQLAAKIYNIPHTSSLASSYSLSNKDEYPYFLRTYPSDTVQILSILALFKKFNWKKALIVYTYDDYGSAYTRLTTAGADQNITFSSIGVSPDAANATYTNVNSTVDSVYQAIEQQEFRIIIYYAQYYPSLAIMTELHNRGIKGGDYVSILTTSMGASFGSPFPWYEGAIAFTSPVPKGPFLDNIYNKWTTDPGNPFPRLPKASLQIGWFAVDAILNYVYTFDKLMKRGMAFGDIKGRMLYQEMIDNTFEGSTGNVAFDEMGDRLMSYSVISLVGNGTQVDAGYYDPQLDDFVQTGPFMWAGGRTAVPRDSPYKCLTCGHGTCVVDVGCVCFPGYYGEGCYEKDEKSNTTFIIAISVGLVAALAVALILVFFVYRRKRYQLVQEVADKQRSKLSRSDINMQKRIGRGASGEVFKASFRGTEVAVKKIIATNVDKSVIREFELEVAIMCGLRHPNIILFMGSCFDLESKEMLLVMEFMAKGSLHDVLHNPTITLNYDMMLHLALQAAQGMNFLHQSTPAIVHQDLKSHNILLDDKWNARISDFGITKFQDKNHKLHKASKADSAIGTVYWSSPEILEGLETTEKSDCYSFGVVLWEIFHRQNPYEGRDPISVALDVMHGNVRPRINPQVPVEMQDLMTKCWEKSPKQRPSFEEIVTVLRECSMKNPSYSVGGGGSNMRTQAPSGKVYIVNTTVSDPYTLWENCPNDMQESMRCHNNLLRGNIDMYRGYEARCDELHSFTVMFHTVQDAMDFCVSTQISLMHVDWPQPILSFPCCQEVMYGETLLWKGLRVRMSIFSGVPNCELDPLTGRMNYIGPVVESAQKLLKKTRGYISISDPVMSEITRIDPNFIQEITTKKQGDTFDTSRNETQSIHTVSIKSLLERENVTMLEDLNKDQLHVLLDVNEMETLGRSNSCNFDEKNPNWVISYKEMEVKQSIGKGAMGDYYLALLSGKEVALKLLINQKIKEDDMLKLMKDSSVMSKINHPNLLKFHGMCLEEDSLASISEFMPKGNLKAMLADQSITISLQQKMKIALDIANGLRYLSEVDDEEIKAHSNLKSYNILIGKDMEAKVADYGHRSLRELARTMTSIGSVAWTAPEMLSGDDQISPKISVYSFGMICWEIYTRQVPYVDQHPIRVVSKILEGYRPALPTNCPPNISQLITNCLSGSPEDRPSWDVIISTLNDIIRNI